MLKTFIVSLLGRALARYDYDLVKSTLAPPPKEVFRLIDVFVLAAQDLMARRSERLSFVQIGAHDGITYDPIRPFVERYGWTGLLIEPQPSVFERLRANYAQFEGLLFECAAIGPTSGELTIYTFENHPELHPHLSMLATGNPDFYNENGKEGSAVMVNCLTPAELLKKHQINSFDVLQVDAEGMDGDILLAFDFGQFRPALIGFESGALSEEMKLTVYRHLESYGYGMTEVGVDTVAYQFHHSPDFNNSEEMAAHAALYKNG